MQVMRVAENCLIVFGGLELLFYYTRSSGQALCFQGGEVFQVVVADGFPQGIDILHVGTSSLSSILW